MPPKRKIQPNLIENMSLKRRTRSSGSIGTATVTGSPSKSKPTIKTYARPQRNGSGIYNTLQGSESHGIPRNAIQEGRGPCSQGDESSEDELNLARSPESPQNPMFSSDTDSLVGRRRTTRVILDSRATRAPEGGNGVDGRSVKANAGLTYSAGERTVIKENNLRTYQKTVKSFPHEIVGLSPTRPTKNPNLSTPQTENVNGNLWNDNAISTLVSNANPRRVTRSSTHIPTIHRPVREHETESLTPTKTLGKSSKRRLEQGRESPFLPSPKKQKLMFDTGVTSPPPGAISEPAFMIPPVVSLYTDPISNSTSDLPSVNVQSRESLIKQVSSKHPTDMHVSEVLPPHFYPCLNSQKRAILRTLQPPIRTYLSHKAREERDDDETDPETNEITLQQLHDLISGTVNRGEGNSCLILGPRGSGKTRLVERCLSNIPNNPIILRLSGWTQQSDRLAMREIAHQLNQQAGTTILVHPDDVPRNIDSDDPDHELNPFLDQPASSMPVSSPSFPLSSHLPTLISTLPTLPRPTIVILDGFDLFSLHPRQSLLYCLFDTAQSCHSGAKGRGLAIVGITTRVDTVNLLEKRVKSRFSGRVLRTAPPQDLKGWIEVAKGTLMPRAIDKNQEKDFNEEWKSFWSMAIDKFLGDGSVTKVLNETFSITRDIRMLNKIMASLVLHLAPNSPFPSVSQIRATVLSQRIRSRSPFLHTLSYPALCLLVASVHIDSTGHSTFTFEMLHECFYDQLRTSMSAPVQVNGGSIGMVRCSRGVLLGAFEYLVSVKLFTCIAPSTSVAKEFVKYRSVVAREDVKKAVDKTGQINLRKWFTKAQ